MVSSLALAFSQQYYSRTNFCFVMVQSSRSRISVNLYRAILNCDNCTLVVGIKNPLCVNRACERCIYHQALLFKWAIDSSFMSMVSGIICLLILQNSQSIIGKHKVDLILEHEIDDVINWGWIFRPTYIYKYSTPASYHSTTIRFLKSIITISKI